MTFWTTKTLAEMTTPEWESLCDGCGKCCCFRLEDEQNLPGRDHGRVYTTDVACLLLDRETALCSDYPDRRRHVPDCVSLSPDTVGELYWLPKTCAYRLVSEGKPLFSWHPLLTGDAMSTRDAGMSVAGLTVGERDVDPETHPERITIWPGEDGIHTLPE